MTDIKNTVDTVEPFFHLRKDAGVRVCIPVRDDVGIYHMWIREGENWIRMQPADLAESCYFSKLPANDCDIYFSFIDFLFQHCRNAKALRLLDCIVNDIHNLGACFRKLELYHDEGKRGAPDTRRFVVTEIEYVVGTCRSLYDLHQRIAQELWRTVDLLDKSVKKKDLPESFAAMALTGDVARSAEYLSITHGLGPLWAAFYPGEAEFLLKMRKFRNDIEHGGLTPQIIFTTHKGFAVNDNSKQFAQFNVWKEETYLPNKLAPIKPVLAYIVRETFRSMGRFVEVLAKEIKFDPEIAPGYKVFLRGHYIDHLGNLTNYIEKDPWYPETQPVAKAAPGIK